MKRFFASAGALVLATAMLASCSAYKSPEKYITVPELSSITLSQADLNKSMQEQIDKILDRSREANFVEIDEAAALGDQVNIDYEGKAADSSVTISADTLKGMKAEKQDLVLGSGSMIGKYTDKEGNVTEGFEDQIIGMKAGETKDITVIFPDSYKTTELRGVKVVFTITVHTVSRLTVDENCLVKVEYAFADPDAKTEDDAETEGDATDDTASTPAAQSEDDTADGEEGAESEEGVTDDSLDEEEDTAKFDKLFKDGNFTVDLAAEEDATKLFNKLFKVDDFRDDITGLHLYEEVAVKVTIPEDVDDDFKAYAGREITINLTIDSATILPEWNDEFVKEYTSESYTTVAAYEEALMKDVKSNAAYEAVLAAVVVDEYPESEFEKLYKQYVDSYLDQKVQSLAGTTLDKLTASELDELIDDTTYKSIRSAAAADALASVKERLVWEYLFEELDITLSNKEYEEKLKANYDDYVTNYMYAYYSYYGIIFADQDDMESYYGKANLKLQYKFNKLMEVLPDKLTVTE